LTTEDRSTGEAPLVSAHAPRVRLTVAAGPGTGGGTVLRRVVSLIGSGPGCKLQLRHREVSKVHCAIVNTGGDIVLRDLVSQAGTFLNDLRVVHEHLEDGDVVKIRPWRLRIGLLPPEVTDGADFTGLGLEPSPAAIVLEDPFTGRVQKLPRDVNLLGRSPDCDFAVDDRSVSRGHALLFTYLSQPAVVDLLSRNGTMVNGQPVTFARLKTGDALTLGTAELRVKVVDTGPRVSPSRDGKPLPPPRPEDSFSDRIDIRAAEVDTSKT